MGRCCAVMLFPSDVFRSASRCRGWLWTGGRWPSVSLPQPWAGGPPLDLARLWARSYGSEPLEKPDGRDEPESRKSTKIYLSASLSQTTEARKKKEEMKKLKLEPIPITDQPSEHVYLFNSLSLLSVFLSLSLSLLCEWIGSQTGLQPGSFCLSYGFWLQLLFSFFGKKRKKKQT